MAAWSRPVVGPLIITLLPMGADYTGAMIGAVVVDRITSHILPSHNLCPTQKARPRFYQICLGGISS